MPRELLAMLDDLDRLFGGARVVGFRPLFDELQSLARSEQNFPPHNIVKTQDDRWFVEIACAGFTAADIDIEVSDGHLHVVGSSNLAEKASAEYLHRGIARRDWNLSFRLGEHVEVEEPIMQDGMLVIPLQRVVPEEKQPRKITIREVGRPEPESPVAE